MIRGLRASDSGTFDTRGKGSWDQIKEGRALLLLLVVLAFSIVAAQPDNGPRVN
jgi:hypothetical protein